MITSFVFRYNGRNYAVNFQHLKVNDYDQLSKKRSRTGILAILHGKYTGTPYSGVALISPSEKKSDLDEPKAMLLACRKAVMQLVASEMPRGEESDIRRRVHDMYSELRIKLATESPDFTARELADLVIQRERELKARNAQYLKFKKMSNKS